MNKDILEFFLAFIKSIENDSPKFINNNIENLITFIEKLKSIYIQYPKWINLDDLLSKNAEIVVLGDIHGDFLSLNKILELKIKNPDLVFVFLGDFVDRGPYSNEVIILVLLLNLLFPSSVFIIPGNHEVYHYFEYQNPQFWIQFGQIRKIFPHLLDLIDVFPVIISFKNILFIHGGFFDFDSKNSNDIDFINRLKSEKSLKLKKLVEDENEKIFDLFWADYVENEQDIMFSKLLGRPVKVLNDILKIQKVLGIELIIRGHQPQIKGVSFDNKLITLITSSLYKNTGKESGELVALIGKGDNNLLKNFNIIKKIEIEDIIINLIRI